MPTIELRQVTDDDLPLLWSMEQNPVARHQFAFLTEESESSSDFDHRCTSYRSDRSRVLRTMTEDRTPVGWVMAEDTGHIPQITFWVDPIRWNQGIASAGMVALTRLMTRRPLQATVADDTVAAGLALVRAGFFPDTSGEHWSELRQQMVATTRYELGFLPATPSPSRRS